MSFSALDSRDAVEQAVAEFDRLGRDAFLAEYGFGPAREYFLVIGDMHYDSKAIVGVAHGYQFPSEGPLRPEDFSGGEATVRRKLEQLGFEVERVAAGARNPPWERDELILALDLYLRRGMPGDDDQEVVALSQLLNDLPLHPLRPDPTRFRNPNGVALKLANFASLDPNYSGVGMRRVSRLDRRVWDEFSHRPDEVARLASAIRDEATAEVADPLPPEEGEDEAVEGRLLFRRHRVRERDRGLVTRKKAAAETLACEVCGFNFGSFYGTAGEGYIECHHVVPLGQGDGLRRTRLADLALVCANCHRVLHRGDPPPSVGGLRGIVRPPSE